MECPNNSDHQLRRIESKKMIAYHCTECPAEWYNPRDTVKMLSYQQMIKWRDNMKKGIIVVLCFVTLTLSGCAGLMELQRDENGRVSAIKSKNMSGGVSYKDATYEENITFDAKKPSPLKDLINLSAVKK